MNYSDNGNSAKWDSTSDLASSPRKLAGHEDNRLNKVLNKNSKIQQVLSDPPPSLSSKEKVRRIEIIKSSNGSATSSTQRGC